MKRGFPSELVYQVFSLLIAFIIVHAVYVTLVRPQAEDFMVQEAANMQADPGYVQHKGRAAFSQHRLLDQDLLRLPENLPIGPEDTRELAGRITTLPRGVQHYLLPRALLTSIERFAATRNVQNVSTAARDICDSEGERLESELSIIRYIAWAIPSVGFIGTVRGIGDALGQAHRAVEGDITGVTASLGVAFNSTFIALVISIVLMFFIHQLQLMQERLVLDCERYVDHWLVRRLKT